jgi:hypothetical protein
MQDSSSWFYIFENEYPLGDYREKLSEATARRVKVYHC